MHIRLKVVVGVVLVGFLVLLGRFTQLQVLSGDSYKELATAQQSQQEAKKLKRGSIFLHKKDEEVLAATERTEYTLALSPGKILNADEVYTHITKFIPLTRAEFDKDIADRSDPFVPLKDHVSANERDAMMSGMPKGIVFADAETRYYPGGELAAHVLGFFGDTKNGKSGRYGVEQFYNSTLQEATTSAASWWSSFIDTSTWYHAGGRDIVLTIDVGAQQQTEHVLAAMMARTKGTAGGILVYEPSTGRILSLAASPTFNPNTYYETKDIRAFVNPMVQNTYELGSVFKPLTMSMAIDAHAVTPETTYNDMGFRIIDTERISNFDGKGRGVIPMQRILAESLNTGAVFLAEKMGKSTFASYIDKLKLKERTGVDLAGEASGDFSNMKDSPRFIETATASFGQGTGMTPLALASALGAIANHGELMTPYVVDEVRGEMGEVEKHLPKSRGQVFSPEATQTVTQMLVKVLDESEALKSAVIPGYTQAVKTGTAQMAERGGGGYKDAYLHSFFGYAPAYQPRFLVFLFVERPQGFQYANQSLTPSYAAMMKFLLTYYEVPPDRP